MLVLRSWSHRITSIVQIQALEFDSGTTDPNMIKKYCCREYEKAIDYDDFRYFKAKED